MAKKLQGSSENMKFVAMFWFFRGVWLQMCDKK